MSMKYYNLIHDLEEQLLSIRRQLDDLSVVTERTGKTLDTTLASIPKGRNRMKDVLLGTGAGILVLPILFGAVWGILWLIPWLSDYSGIPDFILAGFLVCLIIGILLLRFAGPLSEFLTRQIHSLSYSEEDEEDELEELLGRKS